MELFKKFNELDEAFDNRVGELEDYALVHSNEKNFSEYLRTKDEVIEMLNKLNLDKDFINAIETKFEEQFRSICDEMDFLERYFFKVGVFYYAELQKEIKEGIKKQTDC